VRRLALVALALLVAPGLARAETDSDTLAQFGLIGSWALDCHAPASLANPFETLVPSKTGEAARRLSTGNPALDRIEPIHDVILITADRLRLSYPQNSITVTVVFLKENGRIRVLESTTSNGLTVVSGGIVQRNGQQTAWLEKCPG
jgi:hypothetical protein